MLERIRERTRHSEVFYSREFAWGYDRSAGFSFPCDAKGTIEPRNEASLENLFNCIMGVYDVVDEGIRSYHNSWTEPAAVRCDCGREIDLTDSLYNECECGLAVNGSGQRLAPVEQWEPQDRYDVFGPRRP